MPLLVLILVVMLMVLILLIVLQKFPDNGTGGFRLDQIVVSTFLSVCM